MKGKEENKDRAKGRSEMQRKADKGQRVGHFL